MRIQNIFMDKHKTENILNKNNATSINLIFFTGIDSKGC